MNRIGVAALIGYVGSIVLANALIVLVGIVPVGLGLMAPAGVYAVGLSFFLENLVTEHLGRRWTVAAILVGAALSAAFSPHIAFASGATFLISESLDFLVFVRVRSYGIVPAALAGDVASDVLDSVVSLRLAFGSLDFLAGQLVGKWTMTLIDVALLAVWRRRVAVCAR